MEALGLINTEAAARHLGLSRSTLERLRVDGDGPPFVKLSAGKAGAVRYRVPDLEKWIAARVFTTTSELEAA